MHGGRIVCGCITARQAGDVIRRDGLGRAGQDRRVECCLSAGRYVQSDMGIIDIFSQLVVVVVFVVQVLNNHSSDYMTAIPSRLAAHPHHAVLAAATSSGRVHIWR